MQFQFWSALFIFGLLFPLGLDPDGSRHFGEVLGCTLVWLERAMELPVSGIWSPVVGVWERRGYLGSAPVDGGGAPLGSADAPRACRK